MRGEVYTEGFCMWKSFSTMVLTLVSKTVGYSAWRSPRQYQLGSCHYRWLIWRQDSQIFSYFPRKYGCRHFGIVVELFHDRAVHKLRLTGSFPRGCIADPLTAHGDIRDVNKLSGCTFSDWRSSYPALEFSAPDSERAEGIAWPFSEDIWISTIGADSIAVYTVYRVFIVNC